MWQKLTDQFDASAWNTFVKNHGPFSGRFLQSWEWGEFQRAQRWIWATGNSGQWTADSGPAGVANMIMRNVSGFGQYTYCPRGPVVDGDFSATVNGLAEAIGSVLFFRFDPPIQTNLPVHKTIDLQPSHTWITELTSAQELLASMYPKTRYNIKLAQRHGLQIEFDTKSLDEVWPLFEITSGRGKFRLHEKFYYKKMLETLREGDCHAHLVTAVFENKPVAANIMIDFAGVRTYLHGASSYAHRALMAPYLLHWFLLKDAIEQGMTNYDWWGVAPANQSNHPWTGITRFKKSFPGREISYPGTYDLVKRPGWYTLYMLARRLKRVTR
jgi:lipid II:glycine glycyltransferase (peptidoglycan interpeptide bridge formation enzyme)